MIRPLQDRIVVKQTSVVQQPNSLIAIPDFIKATPTQGEVVAVGPGKYEKGKIVPLIVSVGDTVLFPQGSGAPVKVDGQEYLVMVESNITAIVG